MFKRSTQENIQNHVRPNLQQISVFCRKLIIVLSKKLKPALHWIPAWKHSLSIKSAWFSFLRCPPPLNFIPKLLLSLPGIAAVGCFYIDVAAPSSWTLRRPVAKILQYLAPAISPPPPLLSFCNNTPFTLACHLKSTSSWGKISDIISGNLINRSI